MAGDSDWQVVDTATEASLAADWMSVEAGQALPANEFGWQVVGAGQKSEEASVHNIGFLDLNMAINLISLDVIRIHPMHLDSFDFLRIHLISMDFN